MEKLHLSIENNILITSTLPLLLYAVLSLSLPLPPFLSLHISPNTASHMNHTTFAQCIEWHRSQDCEHYTHLLSQASVTHLEALFRSHALPGEGGVPYLDKNAFFLLLQDTPPGAVQRSVADVIFERIKGSEDGVCLEEFLVWVSLSEDEEAALLEERSDASLYASLARTVTSMTKPLSQSVGAVLNLAFRNIGTVLAKYLANPARLFRRGAVGTLELLSRKRGSLPVLHAVRAEFASGGVYGILRLATGPYFYNAIVSFSMFHTYSTLKGVLADQEDSWTNRFCHENENIQIIMREGFAGVCAGLVQGSLNAPAYNVKRKMPGKLLTTGAMELWQAKGIGAIFADLPLMCIQEVIGLAAFFTSYELIKTQLRGRVAKEYEMLSWVVSGMAAGLILTLITHPFDNLHEWHVRHHTKTSPSNAVLHFAQHHYTAKELRRTQIGSAGTSTQKGGGGRGGGHRAALTSRRILFHGLTKRLPMGVMAGFPLLVYELMVGQDHLEDHLGKYEPPKV